MMALLSALNAQDRALRRDECGDWRIGGTSGHLYTWGDGKTWLLFVACHSARAWTAAKARLSFCELTQDGDDEGTFRLHTLPTPDQAAAIRTALGIRKRRINDPLVTEGLRATAKRGFQRQERPLEVGQVGGRHPPLVRVPADKHRFSSPQPSDLANTNLTRPRQTSTRSSSLKL
jgi:hypothetical protein